MAKRRPSGDGMVRKRPDGRWEGRIVVGHKDDGSPIFRSVFGKTQKELLEKLHQQKTLYQDVKLTEESRMTLAEWLDKWLSEYISLRVRPSTLKSYRNYVDFYIKPVLGDKVISKIETSDVQKMYTKLKKEGRVHYHPTLGHSLSDTMIRSIHGALHGAMEVAYQEGFVAKNPTAGATIPKDKAKPKQILSEAELERFMEEIRKDPVWHDLFYTELTTGLRRGELCGLQWQDFDDRHGALSIRRTVHTDLTIGETKTGQGNRTIILPPSTAKLLSNRKENAISQWIFSNPLKPEEPTKPNSAYRKLKIFLENACLPDMKFHDLRHTFATHALTSGVDAKTLSGILGHTKPSFTLDTYTHVTGDMQRKAAEIVGNYLQGVM